MTDLFNNRDVTADWHVMQSRRLIDVAFSCGSSTALVYAALEARNALERLVFEMSVLATGGKFTSDQLSTAQKKDGLFKLLDEALNNYRRHIEFQNICMELMKTPLRFPVPDIRRCKRLRTDLSSYCHCQLDPNVTVNDPSGHWFEAGIDIVRQTCDFLDPLLTAPFGVMHPGTMPAEVREIFDTYISGDININTVRTRLDIMLPVLDQRIRQKEFR